jgi:Nitrile hydratase beta subunit
MDTTDMAHPVRKTMVRSDLDGRAIHDIGGLDFGPVDREEHDPTLWEKRVDAMMIVLYAKKGLFTVDAMRRVIEDYGQQTYDQIGYYDKWVRAMRNLMVEQEILTVAEIEAKVKAVRAAHATSGRTIKDETVPW